jgi:hypothetical protein
VSVASPSVGASRVDHSLRHILIIGGLVVGLVVVTVVTMLVVAPRGPATYAPGSPEAAFQEYLAAFDSGDLEAAYASFSRRVRSATTSSRYLDEVSMYDRGDQERGTWIDSVDRADSRATLHLTIEEFYSSGLTSDSYRYQGTVRMVSEDGAWKIDELLAGVDPIYR